ncbi:hypothetical protein C8Q76DRAFT_852762 [Earliella scabrosa]|nr:hypothetical protein C8Q76DRAFT_852762 [Earliella scabrosa]
MAGEVSSQPRVKCLKCAETPLAPKDSVSTCPEPKNKHLCFKHTISYIARPGAVFVIVVLILTLSFAWASHWNVERWGHDTTFVLCFIAMIPLQGIFDWGGEQLGEVSPEVLKEFIIITLSNAVEATLAIILLLKCELRLLQSTIIGVVLLHLLLVPGTAFFFHGCFKPQQRFKAHHVQMNLSLLMIGVLGTMLSTAFFAALDNLSSDRGLPPPVVLLLVAAALMAVTAEFLVSSIEPVRRNSGIQTEWFGLVLLPIVSFSSDGVVAIPKSISMIKEIMAERKKKKEEEEKQHADGALGPLSLALPHADNESSQGANQGSSQNVGNDGAGSTEDSASNASGANDADIIDPRSDDFLKTFAHGRPIDLSIQFTLLWTPLLVLVGWWTERPMHLLFDYLEVALLLGACFLVNYILSDSMTNMAEGVTMIAFYAMIATVVWYYPGQPQVAFMLRCPGTVAEAVADGVEGIQDLVKLAL